MGGGLAAPVLTAIREKQGEIQCLKMMDTDQIKMGPAAGQADRGTAALTAKEEVAVAAA